MILLDTIVTTTLSLRKRRNKFTREELRKAHFERWVHSLNPEFYVLHRVNGVHEFEANPRVQVKLYLMPLFQASHAEILHPLFKESFILFARIDCVQPYNHFWLSIDATVTQFPSQAINVQVPPEYFANMANQILPKVAFPANIRDRSRNADTFSFELCKLRFYKFHMFYHQSKEYTKRYGVIDRMWDFNGKEVQLSLPPSLDFGTPDAKPTPQNYFPNSSQNPTQKLPSLEEDIKSFLKTYRPGAPLRGI